MKILIILLTLTACGREMPIEPDKWIVCTYPFDGKQYRMNLSRAPKTLAIGGESYAEFPMPNGRTWELTARDANNYCDEEKRK